MLLTAVGLLLIAQIGGFIAQLRGKRIHLLGKTDSSRLESGRM